MIPKPNQKIILVLGSTGKQGRATIAALTASPKAEEFHILALTRRPSLPAAKKLIKDFPDVVLVAGDLTSHDSIRDIFEGYKEEGEGGKGIWGVFVVIQFAGLGVDSDIEVQQGKVIAEVAKEYNVGCFVYSGAERAGERFDDEATPGSSHAGKMAIERKIKELALPWTIIRPAVFMETFSGQLRGLGWAVFSAGLKPTTTLHLIAVDDIGRAAAGVFQHPEEFVHEVLVLRGDSLTTAQQAGAYQKATGKRISYIPKFAGSAILKMNVHLREMMQTFERNSTAISAGEVPEFDRQLELGQKALARSGSTTRFTTFEEWVSLSTTREESNEAGWNRVSILSLFTGRS